MIKLSESSESVQLSLVRSLFNEAKKYNDVIDFTLGDPDIQPHQAIKDAACKAIQDGKTRYSQNAGLIDLRRTISESYFKKEGLSYNPENEIMVTVGAMEGLYLTLLSIIDEGDEVIIPTPYYVNYRQMVRMCHGIPVIVDSKENDSLSINVNGIEKAITPKTKAIMINTPSNPAGKVIDQETLAAIAGLAIKHNLVIVSDEVYKCLIYDNTPFKSIVTYKGMRERTVLVNSISKEFCMTGYRLGYILAPEELIASCTKLQENVAACAPLPSQYAAIEALSHYDVYSGDMVRIFAERRNILYQGLSQASKLKCRLPEATFYMMVDISETGMSSIDFCYSLLREVHVAVVPGITYGQSCDKFIRIAFTIDSGKIKEGVGRIVKFVDAL